MSDLTDEERREEISRLLALQRAGTRRIGEIRAVAMFPDEMLASLPLWELEPLYEELGERMVERVQERDWPPGEERPVDAADRDLSTDQVLATLISAKRRLAAAIEIRAREVWLT